MIIIEITNNFWECESHVLKLLFRPNCYFNLNFPVAFKSILFYWNNYLYIFSNYKILVLLGKTKSTKNGIWFFVFTIGATSDLNMSFHIFICIYICMYFCLLSINPYQAIGEKTVREHIWNFWHFLSHFFLLLNILVLLSIIIWTFCDYLLKSRQIKTAAN